jgi:hypothetical protein
VLFDEGIIELIIGLINVLFVKTYIWLVVTKVSQISGMYNLLLLTVII